MSSDVAKEKEMLKADLYGLIGVSKTATDGEIKKVSTFSTFKNPDKKVVLFWCEYM